METGAIVAVTTHGGAAADTATLQEIVVEAAIGGLIPRASGKPKRSRGSKRLSPIIIRLKCQFFDLIGRKSS
ncbi:MAG TPA: hypothetical protein VMB85_14105 [Bryobacteraceae bacterium]|nr:hypothetical protein [Bryobacteraceae bacterium]